MNQEQIKQQAREMAERCASKIASIECLTGASEVYNQIMQELNLESLLEDKARLDWMDQQPDYARVGEIYYNGEKGVSVREAITNAMQERSGE